MTDASSSRANDNPYLRLDVRPFINCASVRTIHGGSLMRPEVKAAMGRAASQFVNIYELMEKAGKRIGELMGCEFGIVTPGSAAAVCLGTAGAVAGNDPERISRLPRTEGMRNKVLMPKGHRFSYDHAIRMVGTTIHEFASRDELAKLLEDPAVAMICVYGLMEPGGPVPLEDMIALARPKNVPIMVDAASEHIERPSPWLVRGADMVIYSGGKFLQAPQVTGLLLGREKIIRAAWANASPHQGIGRPMKVSKEDIIGVVTALEYWIEERDHPGERKRWQADLDTIARKVKAIDGVEATVRPPAGGVKVPRLVISWDRAKIAQGGLDLRQRLLDGEPRIMLDDMEATDRSVVVDPFNLVKGEAEMVGDAIARALTAKPVAVTASAPTVQVSGSWDVTIDFGDGPATHRLDLTQSGAKVGGRHKSKFFDGEVTGTVAADRVSIAALHRYEGCRLGYRFEAAVKDGTMSGDVVLGTGGEAHQGPVNLSQYGRTGFTARRVDG
jgi:D-glucosaminate-6-phosphate ammonia-lyase